MDTGAPCGTLGGGDDATGPGECGGCRIQTFRHGRGLSLGRQAGADRDGASHSSAFCLSQGWPTRLSGRSWGTVRTGRRGSPAGGAQYATSLCCGALFLNVLRRGREARRVQGKILLTARLKQGDSQHQCTGLLTDHMTFMVNNNTTLGIQLCSPLWDRSPHPGTAAGTAPPHCGPGWGCLRWCLGRGTCAAAGGSDGTSARTAGWGCCRCWTTSPGLDSG